MGDRAVLSECNVNVIQRPGKKAKSAPRPYKQHAVSKVRRSYRRETKLEILSCWRTQQIADVDEYGTAILRKITRKEVAAKFKVAESNISLWKKEEEKILAAKKGSRYCVIDTLTRCKWPQMERQIWEEFLERRKKGKIVRRSWFRLKARVLFRELYGEKRFCFSNGWFHGFLIRHHISLRFTTNMAQAIPEDYFTPIINWFRFNRRNSQLRSTIEGPLAENCTTYMVDTLQQVGRYRLSHILNMDQTPLPFEYLSGRTYAIKGSRTVWAKALRSGWDKRQATLVLAVFADGIPRIQPVIIFEGKGLTPAMQIERQFYDSRLTVWFNPTAYCNEETTVDWIHNLLLPTTTALPTLLSMDVVAFQRTPRVLKLLSENNITPSFIPPGCTGLVQPLDVTVNKMFKDILREKIDLQMEEDPDKWMDGTFTVGDRRILMTKCVADAWEELHANTDKVNMIIQTFARLGLSLPIDGSRDEVLSVKGMPSSLCRVGNWREEIPVSTSGRRKKKADGEQLYQFIEPS